MPDLEPKAWSLTNTILCAFGAVIMTMGYLGYASVTQQIVNGDAGIRQSLSEIKTEHQQTANQMLEIIKQVAVLTTNQNNRLRREEVEMERGTRTIQGLPIKGKGNKENQ